MIYEASVGIDESYCVHSIQKKEKLPAMSLIHEYYLVDIELFPMFFYPLSLAIELKIVSDFHSIINASW